MSTDRIETDFDPDLQEMRYTVSSVISQKFDDNKCPEGFKLNTEQQHCEGGCHVQIGAQEMCVVFYNFSLIFFLQMLMNVWTPPSTIATQRNFVKIYWAPTGAHVLVVSEP